MKQYEGTNSQFWSLGCFCSPQLSMHWWNHDNMFSHMHCNWWSPFTTVQWLNYTYCIYQGTPSKFQWILTLERIIILKKYYNFDLRLIVNDGWFISGCILSFKVKVTYLLPFLVAVCTLRIEPRSPIQVSSWKIDSPGSMLICLDFLCFLKLICTLQLHVIFWYFANIFTHNLYYYGLWVTKKDEKKTFQKVGFLF